MKSVVVPFNNWNLVAFEGTNNENYVALAPICDAIGVASNNQILKVKNDPKFNPYDIISVGADAKSRKMCCIPVKQVGLWLASINSSKVKPEVAPMLLEFQYGLSKLQPLRFNR